MQCLIAIIALNYQMLHYPLNSKIYSSKNNNYLVSVSPLFSLFRIKESFSICYLLLNNIYLLLLFLYNYVYISWYFSLCLHWKYVAAVPSNINIPDKECIKWLQSDVTKYFLQNYTNT